MLESPITFCVFFQPYWFLMPPHLAAGRVLLQQIDLDDDTFRLLPWPEDEVPPSLADSIARVGVLHPPLLKAKKAAGYQVIAGRKRLQAVRDELKAAGCTCLVLPAEAPDLEGLAMNFEDTRAARPLSPVERALFLRKAGRHLAQEQIAARYFPLIDLAPGSDLQEQERLLELEEPLLQAVHGGGLEETVARELGGLPFIDRLALFEVIDLVGMAGGGQRRLVAGCRERARQENRAILDLLAAPAAQKILEDPETDPARKTEALLAWLAAP